MKITSLHLYPIKGLRGIDVDTAVCFAQGLQHDRRFMLFKVDEFTGKLKKVQLDEFPECALFQPAFVEDKIWIRYRIPKKPLVPENALQNSGLEIPLAPETKELKMMNIDLHNSPTKAYLMGERYDQWFSACTGFKTLLVYIGDGGRSVLGTLSPKVRQQQSAVVSVIRKLVTGLAAPKPDWIYFQDVAPFLVTSEASLKEVSCRLEGNQSVDMSKFRPNIVVDGEDAWSEDFWSELLIGGQHTVQLTANCGRCSSIIVDYETGRKATGEAGTVLKKLMKDRRVDAGNKWSPIFGRYGFLAPDDGGGFKLSVGDEVQVTKRQTERDLFDWP